MGLNTYGGFAQGFQQGFGLMEGVKDRRLKEEQLEEQKKQTALDNEFREDTQKFREKQQSDLNRYRTDNLNLQRDNQETKNQLDELRLKISEINANTAATNASVSKAASDALTDPTHPNYKAKVLENEKQQADIDKVNEETRLATANRTEFDNAVVLGDLYELGLKAQNSGLDDLEKNLFVEQMGLLSDKGRFSLSTVLDPQQQRSAGIINSTLEKLASQQPVDASPDVVAAFGDVMGINKSAAVGRVIDDTFVNAPAFMKDGKHVIEGQSLYGISSLSQGKFGGDIAVFVRNTQTGESYPYLAPLTSNRSMASNEAIDFTLDEVSKVAAGTHHMIRSVAPAISREAKDARIKELYGDNKGASGKKEFDEAVKATLQLQVDAIQNGAKPSSIPFMPTEVQAADINQQIGFLKSTEYKHLVEHDKLFGANNSAQKITDVQEWYQGASRALAKAPMPDVQKYSSLPLLQQFPATLGELLGDDMNIRNVATLHGYFNPDGSFADEKGLVEALKRLKFIN